MTDSPLFTPEDIELLEHAEAQAEASDVDGSSAPDYADLRRRIQEWLDQQDKPVEIVVTTGKDGWNSVWANVPTYHFRIVDERDLSEGQSSSCSSILHPIRTEEGT